ncbi:MAG: DNA repair protein RadC [Algicola sp.]|nr:DNA repair protein RadC [Algicola sp.]
MIIKQWPNNERPREKLILVGAAQLSDAELLAIFLRTGTKGMNAVDLSRSLLTQFGSLRTLIGASQDDFCEHKGLGPAKYAQLQAVLEMSRRYFEELTKTTNALLSPDAVKDFLRSKLQDEEHEVFSILYLDNQHRVLKYEELFWGTIDGAMIYPRVVIKKVIDNKAAAVIFAHNHPSGTADPSQADIAITDKLKKALGLIDVRVLDHFIIGHDVVSFAERGLI